MYLGSKGWINPLKASITIDVILSGTRLLQKVPLRPCGRSSWLQIQRSGFDFGDYNIFWETVGLQQGPPSLVSTTEELLERKGSGSGLQNRDYCSRNPLRWPRGNLYLQKLGLTSPTIGGRSVGIVRSRTQATEFRFFTMPLRYVGDILTSEIVAG
jgi:hypothetical protein